MLEMAKEGARDWVDSGVYLTTLLRALLELFPGPAITLPAPPRFDGVMGPCEPCVCLQEGKEVEPGPVLGEVGGLLPRAARATPAPNYMLCPGNSF